MSESTCQYASCDYVSHVQMDLGYDTRWYCLWHAEQMFEDWDDHSSLAILTFPDRTDFENDEYPDRLSILVTAYEHGE